MALKKASNYSDFLYFSQKYSILFFGQLIKIFQEGDGFYLKFPSAEIFQLAGVGGEVKPQPVAPQRLMLEGQTLILLQRAVFGIAHQRMTGFAHLYADLMGASGE